jgi:hypothetical protein
MVVMYLQRSCWVVSPPLSERGRFVIRKVRGVLCLALLASTAAAAGSIPFSGSGSSGVDPGKPLSYDFDSSIFEPHWGIPDVATLAVWSGQTIDETTATFDLAPGISSDLMNLRTPCTGGTTFCASPYSHPRNVATLTADSITFTALPGGELLINEDPFSVNIFSGGADPSGSNFSGDGVTPVPEPSGFALFGSGILGLAAALRRKLLL